MEPSPYGLSLGRVTSSAFLLGFAPSGTTLATTRLNGKDSTWRAGMRRRRGQPRRKVWVGSWRLAWHNLGLGSIGSLDPIRPFRLLTISLIILPRTPSGVLEVNPAVLLELPRVHPALLPRMPWRTARRHCGHRRPFMPRAQRHLISLGSSR